MKELTELAKRIPASPTIALNDKAHKMIAEGEDVIALAGGEPDFDTPEHVVDAAVEALRSGQTRYPTPSKGIVPLLDAIASKMERDNHVMVNPATDIVVTPGGKWALYLGLKSLLNPGDEVLIFDPAWVSYPSMVTMVGATPVAVPLDSENNFLITAEQIRAKITDRTKLIMLNTPCNPTGRVLTSDEANAVAAIAQEHDLYVLSDEIYEKIIFDGREHISPAALPGMAERTLTANGMSKSYAMTGWRLGWLAGPAPVMKIAAKFNTQTVTAAATFTMIAACAALNGPQDMINVMCESYRERRDLIVEALNAIDGVECRSIEGAFYLFPKFTRSSKNSVQLAETILDKAKVAGIPGSAFGASGEGHVRFSIATARADLERAVDRIAAIAHEL